MLDRGTGIQSPHLSLRYDCTSVTLIKDSICKKKISISLFLLSNPVISILKEKLCFIQDDHSEAFL